jgi:hypothetical protein
MATAGHYQGLLGTILLTALVAATTSRADEGCSNARSAQSHFREGVSHVRAERYLEALESFERSNALCPRTSTLLNLAMAHKALYRLVEASDIFRRLLTQTDLTEDERQIAVDELAALEPSIGQLVLDCEVDGAQIRVDGRLRSTTPSREALRVDPGRRIVRVDAPGHQPWERTIEIVPGQSLRRKVTLVPTEKPDVAEASSHRTAPPATPLQPIERTGHLSSPPLTSPADGNTATGPNWSLVAGASALGLSIAGWTAGAVSTRAWTQNDRRVEDAQKTPIHHLFWNSPAAAHANAASSSPVWCST